MNFKIDTKEKFQEITVLESNLTANMTDDLAVLFKGISDKENQNVIMNLQQVDVMDGVFASSLAGIQNKFYELGYSFVICGLNKQVEEMLEKNELLESMNIAPTLSEAWDIVQMEEIERDLLDEF